MQLRSWWALPLIVSTASLLMSGCQYDPYADSYTTTPVKAADLVGTWEPDADTIQAMKTEGGYKISVHRFILRSNGTYSMVNIPDWMYNNGNSNGKLLSASGSWKLSQSAGQGTYTEVLFTHPDRDAMLRGQQAPYKLHCVMGDADEGKATVFEKVSP